MKFKHLKISLFCLIILFCLIVITLVNYVISSGISEDIDEFDYGIPIRLENRTDQNICAIIFPIVTSPGEALEKRNARQIKIEKKSSQFVLCYVGKRNNLKNLIVGVIAWRTPANLDFDVFQKKPYLVQTFYDPKFEIGPEKYGIFANVVIE